MNDPLFKTKTVQIDTLGGYLREIREKLNLDTKTASLLSQIKPSYIEFLETENWSSLPAEVYIRGFLKSLAKLYCLDEQILIEQFEKEYGFEPKPPKLTIASGKLITLAPKKIILAISGLFITIVALYIGFQIRSVLAAPFLEIAEPASDAIVAGNNLIVSGRAEIGADVTINNQVVLTDKNGQFNENIILSSGVNVIVFKVKNKFGKESQITRVVNAQITQKLAQAQDLPIKITLEIGPDSSWIYLEADGVAAQRGTMLPGSTKTFTAQHEILLSSANAGSTKVIYNDKDLGKLGRPGEVIRNVEF